MVLVVRQKVGKRWPGRASKATRYATCTIPLRVVDVDKDRRVLTLHNCSQGGEHDRIHKMILFGFQEVESLLWSERFAIGS